uniref:arginine kinase n=1 Tax=Ditylenchus dipsaci TaxID=166011 RepID=A0A915DVD5_9BILA
MAAPLRKNMLLIGAAALAGAAVGSSVTYKIATCPKWNKLRDDAIKLEEGFNKLQEIKDCHSMLKKHLTKDVISRLKCKMTSLGASLHDVVRSGFANPDSSIGVYAADPECYNMFSALFDPIIQEYHGFGPTEKQPAVDLGKDRISELAPLDKEGKYIKSTRIRCGRTLNGFPFNPLLTKENYMAMQDKVKSALESVTDKQISGKYYPLEGMTKEVQNQLIADHFLFKEGDRFLKEANACNFWPIGRGIFHNTDKTFLVWINEEDHLRLISMQNDGNVGQVLERLIKGIESIESKVPFARDDRLGWLTFCPTNLGTSVRASVHIALPKISKQPDFKEICDKLKLQIRGIHGEHSDSSGRQADVRRCEASNRAGKEGRIREKVILSAESLRQLLDILLQDDLNESLLEFAVVSNQSFRVVENRSFISFLNTFRNFVINNPNREAKDLLPCQRTISNRVEDALKSVKNEVSMKVAQLKASGGGLTMDFAKNQVDFIAVTAHYINSNWQKINFVLVFAPLPSGLKKTSENVKALIASEMNELGISNTDMSKMFVTTDEGSNVCQLGGSKHQSCMCHVGSTMAKRTTRPYRNNALSEEVKNACKEVESALKCVEKLIGKLRLVDQIKNDAGSALRSPVETRWLSYYVMIQSLIKNK